MWTALPAVLVAYVVGSIPFGLATGRLVAGIDIRKAGSGNIGATNVGRVLGAKWGALVLLLDALKGVAATLVPRAFLASDAPELAHLAVGCGVAAVLGHMFPCWLGFRGGKGVATALGVVAMLAPLATLIAAAAFLVVVAATRYVSLASMVGAVAFAAAQFVLLWPAPFRRETCSLAAFGIAVPLLIIVRHRGNIRRLWRGEEPRFRLTRGAGSPEATVSTSDPSPP